MLNKTFAPLLSILLLASVVKALPQFEETSPNGPARGPPQPVLDVPNAPPPQTFTGAMLGGDLRGPCPGLNTLANHGFNMGSRAARAATYTAHLLNGNLEYDLLSIGANTPKTGDASMTRADAFFGDNVSFNAPLFEQFKNFSTVYGNGFWNDTVAAEFRFYRIQQSISNNPNFEMLGFRHATAYGEASFPAAFFVDGRRTGSEAGQLDMVTAEGFFKDGHFPEDFHRPANVVEGSSLFAIYLAHPTQPGRNVNGVDTFEVDNSIPSALIDGCGFYQEFVKQKVVPLYPNPTGQLRKNLMKNLQIFYDNNHFDGTCDQVFPYGQE
ncbi:hypothetical protein BKA70DRAFT_1268828 [Coprinopsis sp. MPI-PUGE-AT-0042]|nr:hypothetical protein BKA70DRAFT_1268828 [Coprinopsis sp. MPI-PUGE-AT-0042]